MGAKRTVTLGSGRLLHLFDDGTEERSRLVMRGQSLLRGRSGSGPPRQRLPVCGSQYPLNDGDELVAVAEDPALAVLLHKPELDLDLVSDLDVIRLAV